MDIFKLQKRLPRKKIADLPKSWKPLLLAGKLLGIAPFVMSNEGHLNRSWFGVAISLTVFSVSAVRLLLLWGKVLSSSHLATAMVIVSSLTDSLGHVATLVAVALNFTTNVQHFRTIIHYFIHVDGLLLRQRTDSSVLTYLQISIYAVYMTLMYGYGTWLALQHSYLDVFYYVDIFSSYTRVFNILLLVNLLIYTKRRFQLVNACLRSMVISSPNSEVTSVTASQWCQPVSKKAVVDRSDIRTLRDAHQSLCELVVISISVFELFLVFYLPYIFADVMWLIYFPMRNDFMFEDRFAAYFTAAQKLVLDCAQGLGLMIFCQSVSNAAADSSSIVSRLLIAENPSSSTTTELNLFLLQLSTTSSKACFTLAGGLITLDMKLFGASVAALITYLVVMATFNLH